MIISAEIRSLGPATYRKALLASVACLTGLMPLASANAQDLSS